MHLDRQVRHTQRLVEGIDEKQRRVEERAIMTKVFVAKLQASQKSVGWDVVFHDDDDNL